MNLKLIRREYLECGIFGILVDESDKQIAVTLEHAFDDGRGQYVPKTPLGTYTCVRGVHRLEHSILPFETFEISNVPNHTNILFHPGNFNDDSDGCCLLGAHVLKRTSDQIIVQSRLTFDAFMELQEGVNSFSLTITREDS